jgi:tRNA (cmo5U34)-methyltransferase
MKEDHSEIVKKHFEKKYYDYDRLILELVPKYEEMQRNIIDLFDFPKDKNLSILDLGVGTGQTASLLLKKFPNSKLDGVDISPKMIEQAKIRLKDFSSRINLIENDVANLQIEKKYDACISVLCLHHLNENQKPLIFKKIYNSLNNGGVFVIGDLIKFDSEKLTKEKEGEWKNYIFRNFGEKEGKYWFEIYREQDLPSTVSDQLRWLEELGFRGVECAWEHMNYAVIVGRK